MTRRVPRGGVRPMRGIGRRAATQRGASPPISSRSRSLISCAETGTGTSRPMMADLIAESKKRLSLMESKLVGHEKLPEEEQRSRGGLYPQYPDFTSYHLLFALKDRSEPAFDSIPASTRARVFCSALSNLKYLNDWGHLTVSPKHGPAMSALIATGKAALPCLKHLLEDRHARRSSAARVRQ